MKRLIATIFAVLSLCGFVSAATTAPTSAPSTQPVAPTAPAGMITHYVAPNGSDAGPGTEVLPWRTPRITGSHQKLLIKAGGTYLPAGISINNLSDVAIDEYGTGSLPILHGAGGVNIFSFSSASQRISIAHVRCDSDWTWAATAGGYRYHQPKAAWGIVRGSDISIDGNELANLTEGISVQGGTRVRITGVKQVEPLGMPSRCVFVGGCTDLVIEGCTFLNSTNESPLRATDQGITRGLIKSNKIDQLLDPDHGRALAKAAVTIRQANGLWFENNTVKDGELSFNTDISGQQTIRNATIEGGIITGSQLTIRPGCYNVTVHGLIVTNYTGSECVADSAAPDAGNVYDGLNLSGVNCGIKSYGPSNFTYKNIVWTGKAGLPLAKGDLSKARDGGGNVTK